MQRPIRKQNWLFLFYLATSRAAWDEIGCVFSPFPLVGAHEGAGQSARQEGAAAVEGGSLLRNLRREIRGWSVLLAGNRERRPASLGLFPPSLASNGGEGRGISYRVRTISRWPEVGCFRHRFHWGGKGGEGLGAYAGAGGGFFFLFPTINDRGRWGNAAFPTPFSNACLRKGLSVPASSCVSNKRKK